MPRIEIEFKFDMVFVLDLGTTETLLQSVICARLLQVLRARLCNVPNCMCIVYARLA